MYPKRDAIVSAYCTVAHRQLSLRHDVAGEHVVVGGKRLYTAAGWEAHCVRVHGVVEYEHG